MFKKVTLALAAALAAVALQAPAAHADAAGAGGDYVALPSVPVVLDTRSGTGGVTGERGPASTTTFPVLGVGAVPTTGVGSVLVRIGFLGPTEPTFGILWPDGTTKPGVTMISAGKDEQISEFAVVKVGANGKIDVFNNAGKTDVVVEVHGYFKSAQGTTGGGFVPVTHTRLVDSRNGTGTTKAQVPAGGTRTVTLTGGVIPAGAAAAVVNIAAPSADKTGWFAAAPGTGTARPVLNYEVGTTQSGAVLALSTDGKVTITNKGPAAVDFMINAEGYITSSATQGAGYREVTKRLFNTRTTAAGVPLAANATVDIQVGGTNGLPTRGVAGAVLNLIVTPEAAGYLKAWPTGEAETGLTVMDFKAGVWRGNLVTLKPGTDGKIRIRNGSSSTTHLIVDLQGWFADPLPTLPIQQDSKMAMLMAAPVDNAPAGTIEHAYVDNGGDLRWGHQTQVDVEGAVNWTVISAGNAFTGQPSIQQLADGRLEIFAQRTDGDIWSVTQKDVGGSVWNAWTDLGGSMAAPAVTAKLGNGTVVLFATDVDGKLWAYEQTGSVPFWHNLGDQDLAAGTVQAIAVNNGIRVFGVTTGGSVRTIQYFNDGGLSPWTDLGGLGLNGTPALVLRPGFVPEVFVRGADGVITSKLQGGDGSWPADWQPLPAATSAGSPAAIMDPARSQVAVVYRQAADNEMYIDWETATGKNTFDPVPNRVSDPNQPDPSATDPFVAPFINSNGQTFMICFRSATTNAPRFYSRKL
ncbi:hypothetical protein GCM10029964_075030 [Kibdelosporangium lantanae]